MTTDIEDLIARVDLGDRQAFKLLHTRVAGQLMAVAMRILNERGTAEDVVQEVFIGLWNKASHMTAPVRKGMAWLCVVTRNRAIDTLRRRPSEVPLHWQTAEGDEMFHDTPSDNSDVFEQLQFEQDNTLLQECLKRLDAAPRQAILLAYCDGLTHIELALRLQRPLGTIKAWTRRSLMQLKTCMEAAT
jgi:RNA polymerase sigma-70 factor, ECF subfamily